MRGAARKTPRISIRCDLRGKAAGQVVWRQNSRPLIRYNLQIARLQTDTFVAETVPHEVAHVVARLLHPQSRPHGKEWRLVMQYLGVEQPQRCHSFEIPRSLGRRQRRWRYQCNCQAHQLSTTRHNRIQNGRNQYLCRCCGAELRPGG